MNTKHYAGLTAVAALLLVALLLGAMSGTAVPAAAAPLAAPTPVTEPRAAIQPTVVELFSGKVITGDVRTGCIDTRNVNKLDVYYSLETGAVNTTTVKLQHLNTNPAAAGAQFADGANVITGVVTTTVGMQQAQAFGAWTCVYVDVTNANATTATINALVK